MRPQGPTDVVGIILSVGLVRQQLWDTSACDGRHDNLSGTKTFLLDDYDSPALGWEPLTVPC